MTGAVSTSVSASSGLDVEQLAAFAAEPGGGNPAGVVFDAARLSDDRMQRIALELGHAETAFIVESSVGGDNRHVRLRYFSPEAEVPFCGHATIATGVALASRSGAGAFSVDTNVGTIEVLTTLGEDSLVHASFGSVEPAVRNLDVEQVLRLTELLGIAVGDLDDRLPVREAFAGNWHPIVTVRDRHLFDSFTFDPATARALMDECNWQGTIMVVWVPRSVSAAGDVPLVIQARNLFPVGDITEDPATGSAAAALGAYLRAQGFVDAPARFLVQQGRHVGRPSELVVDMPVAGGITVGGTAEFIL